MLACRRIEARARLVQDEQTRPGHQRAANQYALAFALRQDLPGPIGQWGAFDLLQQAQRPRAFARSGLASEIYHRVLAAEHRFQRRFIIRH